ncbi:hypothetical protein PENSPDRAFT_674063 [Peniophora sp. CONT]|nr:hypothetical protein PENSPDRAFT_674063 [Peniophora sp. CONT]
MGSSFLNFRLDGPSTTPTPPLQVHPQYAFPPPGPLPPPADGSNLNIQLEGVPHNSGSRNGRGPYGSGDMDDGYTLVFENLEAFLVWRAKEEDDNVVEFVKGDTHGSKAVPPRFKEHVKLVCARHCRTGRKKYVKKYPERVRKVPSRKLEGTGCGASISYKTYHHTDEIRVCYISQHSHEIGLANLPYTRRGRKDGANHKTNGLPQPPGLAPPPSQSPNDLNNAPGPSAISPPSSATLTPGPSVPPPPEQPPMHFAPTYPHFPSMSMPPPPGLGGTAPPPPPGIPMPHAALPPGERERLERERWERNGVMFDHIRALGRTGFPFNPLVIAALETTLVQGYLVQQGLIPPPQGIPLQVAQQQQQGQPQHVQRQPLPDHLSDEEEGAGGGREEEEEEEEAET